MQFFGYETIHSFFFTGMILSIFIIKFIAFMKDHHILSVYNLLKNCNYMAHIKSFLTIPRAILMRFISIIKRQKLR